jgi:hypothetical protein
MKTKLNKSVFFGFWKMLPAFALGCALPCVSVANANSFLTYTGNNFNEVGGVYTTSQHVTLTIEFSAPLPSNYTGVLPNLVHWTAFDGVQTISDTQANSVIDPSANAITTNQNGSITKWKLEFATSSNFINHIFTTNDNFFPPNFQQDSGEFLFPTPGFPPNFGHANNNPGIWSAPVGELHFWSACPPRGGVSFDPSFALRPIKFSVDGA